MCTVCLTVALQKEKSLESVNRWLCADTINTCSRTNIFLSYDPFYHSNIIYRINSPFSAYRKIPNTVVTSKTAFFPTFDLPTNNRKYYGVHTNPWIVFYAVDVFFVVCFCCLFLLCHGVCCCFPYIYFVYSTLYPYHRVPSLSGWAVF